MNKLTLKYNRLLVVPLLLCCPHFAFSEETAQPSANEPIVIESFGRHPMSTKRSDHIRLMCEQEMIDNVSFHHSPHDTKRSLSMELTGDLYRYIEDKNHGRLQIAKSKLESLEVSCQDLRKLEARTIHETARGRRMQEIQSMMDTIADFCSKCTRSRTHWYSEGDCNKYREYSNNITAYQDTIVNHYKSINNLNQKNRDQFNGRYGMARSMEILRGKDADLRSQIFRHNQTMESRISYLKSVDPSFHQRRRTGNDFFDSVEKTREENYIRDLKSKMSEYKEIEEIENLRTALKSTTENLVKLCSEKKYDEVIRVGQELDRNYLNEASQSQNSGVHQEELN